MDDVDDERDKQEQRIKAAEERAAAKARAEADPFGIGANIFDLGGIDPDLLLPVHNDPIQTGRTLSQIRTHIEAMVDILREDALTEAWRRWDTWCGRGIDIAFGEDRRLTPLEVFDGWANEEQTAWRNFNDRLIEYRDLKYPRQGQ